MKTSSIALSMLRITSSCVLLCVTVILMCPDDTTRFQWIVCQETGRRELFSWELDKAEGVSHHDGESDQKEKTYQGFAGTVPGTSLRLPALCEILAHDFAIIGVLHVGKILVFETLLENHLDRL